MRRRSRVLSIIVMVLALHAGLVWLLIRNWHSSTPATGAAAVELLFIAAVALRPQQSPPATHVASGYARRIDSERAEAPTTAAAVSTAPSSLTDWNAELDRTARDATARPSQPTVRDFGFPNSRPAPSPRAEEFGWDHMVTHRVESMPEGGIVVHLNDNCVLVLFPLPFMGCGIGKKKTNGELFEHMHDPAVPSAASAAP